MKINKKIENKIREQVLEFLDLPKTDNMRLKLIGLNDDFTFDVNLFVTFLDNSEIYPINIPIDLECKLKPINEKIYNLNYLTEDVLPKEFENLNFQIVGIQAVEDKSLCIYVNLKDIEFNIPNYKLDYIVSTEPQFKVEIIVKNIEI